MRLLSSQLEALGGFLPTHPSSPARGGNSSLTRNIEPKSTWSYTQCLPPSFHSTDFSLPFSIPLLFPTGNVAPSSYSSARPSLHARLPSRPRVTRRTPSFLRPRPLHAGRLLERVRWSPGRKRKETNRIGLAAAMATGGCSCIVIVTNVSRPGDPPLANGFPGRCPGFPLGFPYI